MEVLLWTTVIQKQALANAHMVCATITIRSGKTSGQKSSLETHGLS